MNPSDESKLAHLPDDAMHVEALGLARRAGARVLADGDRGGFVFVPVHELAAAYGAPGLDVLDAVLDAAAQAGLDPLRLELHAPEGAARAWIDAAAVEVTARARVLRWGEGARDGVDSLVRHEARSLGPDDDALETLPIALRRELDAFDRWPASSAAFVGDAIASLAYAFVETDALWDVSIDTLPEFRREGYATSAAAHLITTQLRRGLRPVWGADVDNAASLALARRLGFVPEGTIVIARAAS